MHGVLPVPQSLLGSSRFPVAPCCLFEEPSSDFTKNSCCRHRQICRCQGHQLAHLVSLCGYPGLLCHLWLFVVAETFRVMFRGTTWFEASGLVAKMSFMLPHLHSGWAVDQAILSILAGKMPSQTPKKER